MMTMRQSSLERHALQGPVLWGLAIGAVQAASPLILQWIEAATLHAMYISLIAAIGGGHAAEVDSLGQQMGGHEEHAAPADAQTSPGRALGARGQRD